MVRTENVQENSYKKAIRLANRLEAKGYTQR